MNEHIRRLAGEALDQAVPQTWTTLTADDLNKFTEVFAELLVRECVSALEDRHNTFKGSQGGYGNGFKSGLDAATRTVKHHFGVNL